MNGFLNSQIGMNYFFFLKPKKIKFEGHGVKARRHGEVTDARKRKNRRMDRPEAPEEVDGRVVVITSILQTRRRRLKEVVNLAEDIQWQNGAQTLVC